MNLQRLAMYGTLMAGLSGCNENRDVERIRSINQELLSNYYSATVPVITPSSPLALTTGDFDGDGDLDIVAASISYLGDYAYSGFLYLYLNDGDANFTVRNPNFAAESTLNQPYYGWPDCSGNRWETDACAETRHRLGHD